jgi:predicted NAD-dependent protein-ADP-ribosyltransferase YbiA (DUF1768 family)
MSVSQKSKTLKDNLEFVYGRKIPEGQIPDPDKFKMVRSAPRMEDATAINDFSQEYGFLAPSFPCQVFYYENGEFYPSFEHALLASKTNDTNLRLQIKSISDIIEVKKLVTKSNREDPDFLEAWKEKCTVIAGFLVRDKYFRNKEIKSKLVGTGNKTLNYFNDHKETFWGYERNTKNGKNHLGKLTEQIRLEISKNIITSKWVAQIIQLTPENNVNMRVSVLTGEQEKQEEFPFKNALYVGKEPDCEIIADHVSFSRLHAVIVSGVLPHLGNNTQNSTQNTDNKSQTYIIDLGSANGTEVNNTKITPFILHPLDTQSQITFAASHVIYRVFVDTQRANKAKQMKQEIISTLTSDISGE